MSTAFLPSGLPDRIHQDAARAYSINQTLLAYFSECGFELIAPPLMEYASALEKYSSPQAVAQSFRMLDPLSGELMAVRSDMTPQIMRIAGTTMAKAPRPLTVSYSGNVVRVNPDGLRTRRQYLQVGIELFGADENAEATILSTITKALEKVGLNSLTLSISQPGALKAWLETLPPKARADASDALSMRDEAALRALGHTEIADILAADGTLGTADNKAIDLLTKDAAGCSNIAQTHLDALDNSYGDYFSGIGFAIYANEQAVEIGRGGRYQTPEGEEAVGFTLYIEDILPLASE